MNKTKLRKPNGEEEIRNVCMEDNGRTYIYCFSDNNWKEKEVCLVICSDGKRNRCYSWRLHIEKKPIRARKTKKEVRKEKEGV